MTPTKQSECCIKCNDVGNCVFKDCFCHPWFRHTPVTPEWEKKFDNKFLCKERICANREPHSVDINKDDVKDFIRTLLTQSRHELIETICKRLEVGKKGHKDKNNSYHMDDMSFGQYTPTQIYNKALTDAITIIKKI